MKVLLSIKPEFAEKIFSGEKTFEFRKSVFRDRSIKTVVVYVTRPVSKFFGEFDVADIIAGAPEDLWHATSRGAGISRAFFDEYFEGRKCAFALQIENVVPYPVPISPTDFMENFVPPQSYMYVGDNFERGHSPETIEMQLNFASKWGQSPLSPST